jgi:hypothetical protein
MLRFGRNLKTLDAEIKYIGVAYGDSSDNINLIKDKIKHMKIK